MKSHSKAYIVMKIDFKWYEVQREERRPTEMAVLRKMCDLLSRIVRIIEILLYSIPTYPLFVTLVVFINARTTHTGI